MLTPHTGCWRTTPALFHTFLHGDSRLRLCQRGQPACRQQCHQCRGSRPHGICRRSPRSTKHSLPDTLACRIQRVCILAHQRHGNRIVLHLALAGVYSAVQLLRWGLLRPLSRSDRRSLWHSALCCYQCVHTVCEGSWYYVRKSCRRSATRGPRGRHTGVCQYCLLGWSAFTRCYRMLCRSTMGRWKRERMEVDRLVESALFRLFYFCEQLSSHLRDTIFVVSTCIIDKYPLP